MPNLRKRFAGDYEVRFTLDGDEVYRVTVQTIDLDEMMTCGYDRYILSNEELVALTHIALDVLHMAKVRELANEALKSLVEEALQKEKSDDLPF